MISIITPVYNSEHFIEACIKAVIAQACPDVEHIIVDGGSTDQTVKIIQTYAEKYPHIRWISEKDQGQSDAMNKGILMAKGEIIGFLNADDYYEPNVLNRVSQLFAEMPEPSFVAGNCNIRNEDSVLLEVNKPTKLKLYQLLMGCSKHPFPYNPSAYFYHTSLHDKVGLYEVKEHYAMDLDFILRAVQAANVKHIDETWGNFVYHSAAKTFNSNSSGQNRARAQKLFRTYRKRLPLLQRWLVALIYEYYENDELQRMKSLVKNTLAH